MKNNEMDKKIKPNHAPGTGSDKQHPDTPPDANEKFRNQQKHDIQDKTKNKHVR